MDIAFQNAKWVWADRDNKVNSYVEFIDYLEYNDAGNVQISIACDSRYALYIGGQFVSFGQYGDYPYYKVYEKYDITKFIKSGKNKIAICVWYKGKTSQCYARGDAGLIYEISSGEKALCSSGKNTLCRYSKCYDSEFKTCISSQLGFSFAYDASLADDWKEDYYNANEFKNAVELSNSVTNIFKSTVEKTVLKPRVKSRICQQGEFIYESVLPESTKINQAFLAYRPLHDLCGDYSEYFDCPKNFVSTTENGIYFIVDLGSEEAGFIDFEMTLDEDADIDIAFGEHLADGRVRCSIHNRNFIAKYHAKRGVNKFINPFLRIGCRYLQFFVSVKKVTLNYAGLLPTVYPLAVQNYKASNMLRQKIYDTSVKTLTLCMHEHYEDTPWREQGLYIMDSRNQMIFGFYAFNETKFARANLVLMTHGLRKDNLFDITFPTTTDVEDMTLPYFTYVYPIAVYDYMEFSGDKTLGQEVLNTLIAICDSALDRIQDSGIAPEYKAPKWNFYEWQNGYDGTNNYSDKSLIQNAMLSLSALSMAKICDKLALSSLSAKYYTANKNLNDAIVSNFYDSDSKLFKSYVESGGAMHFSQLGNSLAILCGAAQQPELIAEKLVIESQMMPTTLSMSLYKYEALRAVDSEKYKDFILNEIDTIYSYMLFNGATSFWETINGEKDFDRAGSLCHGWSAAPILYYQLFDKQ